MAEPMTQADLLTTARLKLCDGVRRSVPRPDCVLFRSPAGSHRLVLTPAQASILAGCFSTPATVPEALVHLLVEQTCPPLAEYYELVLQANVAGVLISGEEATEPIQAHPFPIRLPPRAAGFLAGVLACIGTVALIAMRWSPPGGWVSWLLGWLAACLLLSVGEALAACSLTGEASEVRRLALRWRSLFPHFEVDSEEAAMDGRPLERQVALLRTAPVILGAGFAAWSLPNLLAPILAGVFFVLGPWRGTAANQWICARFASPRFSVQTGFLFNPRREDLWARFDAWRKGLSRAVVLHCLSWIVLLALALVRLFPEGIFGMASQLGLPGRMHSLLLTALYGVAASLGVAAFGLGRAYLSHWRLSRRQIQPLREDWTHSTTDTSPLAGDPLTILRQVALLRDIGDEALTAIGRVIHPVNFGKGAVVFSEDDPADAFYVVLAGEVAVLKRMPEPSERLDTIGRLGPSKCFGEIALLEGSVRTATIRTTCPSTVLKLEKADFDRLLVNQVGARRVREVLQHAEFLGRLVFLAGWSFEDLVRYAQQCGTIRFSPGAEVLVRGRPNNFFYLIFDGAFEARDGARVLRRMGPGDYFGEISLLEGNVATADVFAIEESRCLTMIRSDFLQFFARDFRIGIRMTSVAAQRLAT